MFDNITYLILEDIKVNSLGDCEKKYFEFLNKYDECACNMWNGVFRIIGFKILQDNKKVASNKNN